MKVLVLLKNSSEIWTPDGDHIVINECLPRALGISPGQTLSISCQRAILLKNRSAARTAFTRYSSKSPVV